MKLDRVVMTGADDTVKPEDLIALSQEFPFSEFGILSGGPDYGSSRFPSVAWIEHLSDLVEDMPEASRPNLCAHLCGKYVKWLFAGETHPDHIFQRSQINTHGFPMHLMEGYENFKSNLITAKTHWPGQFIFQCDGENDAIVKEWVAEGLGVPLFDTSSGAGVLPSYFGESWPKAWDGTYCGYAGGLGPENVVEQVTGSIKQAVGAGTIWIDMESRLYSNRIFDLGKCRQVLEAMKPFIGVNLG